MLLLPIYAASEDPIEGIDSEHLMEGIKEKGHREVRLISNRAEVIPSLQEILRPGDVLVTLGAGDVWKIGQELVSPDEGLKQLLEAICPGRVKQREPLSPYTTIRIGGRADWLIQPENIIRDETTFGNGEG